MQLPTWRGLPAACCAWHGLVATKWVQVPAELNHFPPVNMPIAALAAATCAPNVCAQTERLPCATAPQYSNKHMRRTFTNLGCYCVNHQITTR